MARPEQRARPGAWDCAWRGILEDGVYTLLLTLHSLVRWLVVIAAVVAVIHAWTGWLGKRPWTSLADRLGLIFTVAMDVQLLLGVILYFISPLIQGAFADFGQAMATSGVRFFAVEHVALMIVAVIVAHVGRTLAKRAQTGEAKYKRAALLFTLAVVLVLVAIPWQARPLFRLG